MTKSLFLYHLVWRGQQMASEGKSRLQSITSPPMQVQPCMLPEATTSTAATDMVQHCSLLVMTVPIQAKFGKLHFRAMTFPAKWLLGRPSPIKKINLSISNCHSLMQLVGQCILMPKIYSVLLLLQCV